MTLLIVNADDFGYTQGVSRGIVHAFRHGLVTSASVMTTHMGIEDALLLLRLEREGMGVGVHLNLTRGRPLTEGLAKLVGGELTPRLDWLDEETLPLAEEELSAQLEALMRLGVRPDHLNTHHHLHAENRLVFDLVVKLAKRHRLGVRAYDSKQRERLRRLGLVCPDRLVLTFYGPGASFFHLRSLLWEMASRREEAVELVCHPGEVDPPLRRLSSYSIPRQREMTILSLPGLRELARDLFLTPATYRDLWGQPEPGG